MASLLEGSIFYARRGIVPLVIVIVFFWLYYNLYQEDINKYQPQCIQRPVVLSGEPPVGKAHTRPSVSEALRRSEKLYQTFITRRDAMLERQGFGSPRFSPWAFPTVWWWYFQPAFTCPHEVQRIGTVADGGKWVCGFSLYEENREEKCIVYSLGVNDDSTFEDEFLQRTSCEIYAFDASVDGMANGLANNPRVHFQKVFVGKEDKVDGSGIQWKTLKTIMKEYGHTWVDVLKIDIEGGEYDTLGAVMADYAGAPALPFSQLQLEMHLFKHGTSREINFGEFLKFFRRLEAAGLRPFWDEPNLLPTALHKYPLWFSEYGFMNIAGKHRLIRD
ncbi:hypothetical protein DFQ26_006740 [Actinomortierella ambigua]|nr:hypothetical protein DFQ26_006740 [Actinomortierella ambigua]